MVLVNQGLPSGPLTSEALHHLKYVSYAVLGLWACGVSRMLVDTPFNGLATLFSAICGTYTFMNDSRFVKCYDFMARNCTVCGTGGAQCLGPFMSICLINSIFDVFRFFSLLSGGVVLLVPVTSFVIIASIGLQIYAFVTCLRVYKSMVQPFDSPLPRTTGDNRPFLQPRQYVSLSGEPPQASAPFVPFAGEGRRLA